VGTEAEVTDSVRLVGPIDIESGEDTEFVKI
jgi:hypothetical protein